MPWQDVRARRTAVLPKNVVSGSFLPGQGQVQALSWQVNLQRIVMMTVKMTIAKQMTTNRLLSLFNQKTLKEVSKFSKRK